MASSLVIATSISIYDLISLEKTELYIKALVVVFGSLIVWLTVTFLTAPEPDSVLEKFYKRVKPGGFWPKRIVPTKDRFAIWSITAWIGGVMAIYGGMFLVGSIILNKSTSILTTTIAMLVGTVMLVTALKKQKIF